MKILLKILKIEKAPVILTLKMASA